MELAACLHCVGALDALMGIGDLLELLEALDVVLGRLAAGTRACSGDGIGCLDKHIEDCIRLDVCVVCLDSMDDLRLLAVAAGKVCTDDGMRAFHLMVDGLADVMQESCTLCRCLVHA